MKTQPPTAAVTDLDPTISVARVLVVYLGAMAVAGIGLGQPIECSDEPDNLLRWANCGFESGIAGWSSLVGDNATSNLVEGHPSPGSYQLDSIIEPEDGDRAIAILSPCVPIAPSSTYQLEGQFKLIDPLDEVYCDFFVAGYSANNCAGSPVGMDSLETRVTGSEWTAASDTYMSQPTSSSMNIFTNCYGITPGPVFTLLMDNFIVSGALIFADGFESGGTALWSHAVGEVRPVSCLEIQQLDFANGDGRYTVDLASGTFEVYCDFSADSGGWTRVGALDTSAGFCGNEAITDLRVDPEASMGKMPDSDAQGLMTRTAGSPMQMMYFSRADGRYVWHDLEHVTDLDTSSKHTSSSFYCTNWHCDDGSTDASTCGSEGEGCPVTAHGVGGSGKKIYVDSHFSRHIRGMHIFANMCGLPSYERAAIWIYVR